MRRRLLRRPPMAMPPRPTMRRWRPRPPAVPPAFVSLEIGRPRVSNRGWCGFARPHIILDGLRMQGRWGHNELTVPPGRHFLTVLAVGRWVGGGQRTLAFDARPGQRVPVFYAAPTFQGGQGAIGFTPVASSGSGLMLFILIGPAAFGLFGGLLAVIIAVLR